MNRDMSQEDHYRERELSDFLARSRGKPGALIPSLQKAQDLFGHLPAELQTRISRELRIPLAEVYGVVTFYSQFTMEKKGLHHISVCLGTACYIRGAGNILEAIRSQLGIEVGHTTEDGLFTLDTARCLGTCGLAPVVLIDKKVYGRLDPGRIKTILDQYRRKARE